MQIDPRNDPPVLVVSRPQASRMVGVAEATIERLEKVGEFPKPIKLSPRRIGYRVDDLKAWLAAAA
jgi:prophage regulatory protein